MEIELAFDDGSCDTLDVDVSSAPPWHIKISKPVAGESVFSDSDLFEALRQLRVAAESVGARVLCKGSRPDAVVSRLQRGMSGGRAAYLVKLGSQGRMDDVVDIFDPEAKENTGRVCDQEEFRERWLKSLS